MGECSVGGLYDTVDCKQRHIEGYLDVMIYEGELFSRSFDGYIDATAQVRR
jgi:hypothetical protein